MDVLASLHQLKAQPTCIDQIAHVEHIPSREAAYAELDKPLPYLILRVGLHAAIGILPLFALYDRNDTGGVSNLPHPDTGRT